MALNESSFVDALKWQKIEFWIREEVVSSQRLGIDRLKPIALENLLEAQIPEDDSSMNKLQSIHNYDILTNP